MYRIIAQILMVFLLCGSAFAGFWQNMGAVIPSGASCSASSDAMMTQAGGTELPVGRYSTTWIAANITVTDSYTLCSITLPVTVVGIPAFNVIPCLYSGDNGSPDEPSVQLACGDSIPAPTVTGDFSFTISQAVVPDTYHIVLKPSGNSSSNYFSLVANTTAFLPSYTQQSADSGVTWSQLAARQASYELFK